MVTVFSKPACIQCTMTIRALDASGVKYVVLDVTTNEDALNTVRELGYMQAPVVVWDDDHWSGFQPDLIKARIEALAINA